MNYAYTYDARGNIASETCNGQVTEYSYDAIGQLIGVSDQREGAIWEYDYDCGGNILQKRMFQRLPNGDQGALLETSGYTYDAAWRDKLASFEGKSITYDAIGNPLTFDGRTFEWEGGRQLKKITLPGGSGGAIGDSFGTLSVDSGRMTVSHTQSTTDMNHMLSISGGTLSVNLTGDNPYALSNGVLSASGLGGGTSTGSQVVEFKYDANGLRTQKNVGGVVTDYTLYGKRIAHLKQGNDEMHFFYAATGRPVLVAYNGTVYTYIFNLQGDVVGLLDANGTLVVEYRYDAWGKPTLQWSKVNVADRPLTTEYERIAKLNPFRFRGYVWDEETGLYYLRSRYYSPVWCRFICGDILLGLGDILGHSLYSYCKNDPINRIDPSGCLSFRQTPPTLNDGYVAPKRGPVWNKPRGGWEDINGNIWQPVPPGAPNAHGGAHWDVQNKKGNGYVNRFPGGKVLPGKGTPPIFPPIPIPISTNRNPNMPTVLPNIPPIVDNGPEILPMPSPEPDAGYFPTPTMQPGPIFETYPQPEPDLSGGIILIGIIVVGGIIIGSGGTAAPVALLLL